MTPEELADLAHLRRARDLMDRDYAEPLDVPATRLVGKVIQVGKRRFARLV